MTAPELNTDFMRDRVGFHAANPEAARLKVDVLKACDEIDRLRASNEALVRELKRAQDRFATQARSGPDAVRSYNDLCDEVDRLRFEVEDLTTLADYRLTEAWSQSERANAAEAAVRALRKGVK